ncbi:MAG: hypothetical protein V7K38_12675 [Nostoc sp.]|uniref:hypothetical protein n=1 Tax=Nostoc sp. TaxID=1180 RepID=UPI002FF61C8D
MYDLRTFYELLSARRCGWRSWHHGGMPPARVLTLNPLPYKTSCKKCVACFCCKAAVPAALQQRKVA